MAAPNQNQTTFELLIVHTDVRGLAASWNVGPFCYRLVGVSSQLVDETRFNRMGKTALHNISLLYHYE